MRKWVALLIALPLLYQSAFAGRIEAEKKLTVLVTNEGFLGGGRGSGILMDETHILTCAHMADSFKDELFVYIYPLGVVSRASIENVNMAADLMLLKLEKPVKVNVKPVFQSKVEDGEPITVVGNALGSMKWYVTRGVISGHERDYLMTDAAINHGNSGGPWFNEKGQIVAITDWGIDKERDYVTPGISGGISAKTVLDTLQGWEDQKKGLAALLNLLGGK